MAKVPTARDTRARGSLPGRVVGVCVILFLLYLLPVAFTQSQGTSGAPRPRDDGEVPAPPLGDLNAALLFIGIPLAIFVVVSLLVLLPDLIRRPRYRPHLDWSGGATWFAGPQDAEDAVRNAKVSSDTKGGARARW